MDQGAPLFGIAPVEVHGADVDPVDIVLKPMPKVDGELRLEHGGFADAELGSIYFMRTDEISMMGMRIAHPDKD